MGSLQDRVVLVTGAGSGVGRASALALAAEGAWVVLSGRRRAALEVTAEAMASVSPSPATAPLIIPCDITDPEGVRALVAATLAEWGRIDILVNNAGVNVPRRALEALSWEDWQAIVTTNLNGPFLCTHAALPAMRAQGGGTLIHIGSVAARRVSPVSGAAYTAAKAGLAGFSAAVNAEERSRGIRSSVITLGMTDTPLMEQRPTVPSAEERARSLRPEDVASAVLFIASLPAHALIEELVLVPTSG